jgi:hypothetical protein
MLGATAARLAAGAAGLDHQGAVPRHHGRRERTERRAVDDHLRHLGVLDLARRGLGDAVVERLVARGFAVAARLGSFLHHGGMPGGVAVLVVGGRGDLGLTGFGAVRQQGETGRAGPQHSD